jgi:hypothetical protein
MDSEIFNYSDMIISVWLNKGTLLFFPAQLYVALYKFVGDVPYITTCHKKSDPDTVAPVSCCYLAALGSYLGLSWLA